MSRFIYHEKPNSKIPVRLKSLHFISYLMKAKILCKDPGKKERIVKRINSIKKSVAAKDYPRWFEDHPNGRLAVYTVLYGDYDKIKPVGFKSPQCDFFIITDQDVDGSLGWKKIDATLPEELKDASNSVKNRYFKMHPDVLFPEYEYSLYLDATIEPEYDLFPLLGRMGEKFIGMFRHGSRDCIYEEAKTVVRIGKVGKEDAAKLTGRYKEEGFPEHFGLTAGGIILRRHSDAECKKVMDDWWRMYLEGPKRDQLSFMYCLWKRGYELRDVAELGQDYEFEPRIGSEAHNQ